MMVGKAERVVMAHFSTWPAMIAYNHFADQGSLNAR